MSALGDDEEAITSAEVLKRLELAWSNEKLAPELLHAKPELVDCMMEQIKEMEESIKRVKKGDFVASLHQLEIERIRFVTASYLRTRLKKIETHYAILLDEEEGRSAEEPSRLSPEELAYAKQYSESVEAHFNVLALQGMPSNLRTFDREKMAVRSNLDSYVFFRVLKRCDQVAAEEDEVPVDLERNTQHIMRYRPVALYLANDSISLL
eukprot:m.41938 g.41938  ORF g.41938 m.41938 type:complete len:209 (+) comp33304_c0_seq1:224-850(+)